jgi:hypothetical protein
MCRSVPSELHIISAGVSARPSASTLIGQPSDWITGMVVFPPCCFVESR